MQTKVSKQQVVTVDTNVNQFITTHDQVEQALAKFSNIDESMLEEILSLSEFYSIDPGFILATFALETGWGNSRVWLENNNPGGIMNGNEYAAYSSQMEGMHAMVKLIYHYTIGYIPWVGELISVQEIRNTWSGLDDNDTIVSIWQSFLE